MLFAVGVLKMIETQFKYVQKCRHEINTNAPSRRPMQQRQLRCFLYKAKAEKGGRTGQKKAGKAARPDLHEYRARRARARGRWDGGGGGGRTEGRWPDGMRSLLSRCDIWLYSHAPADLVIWLTKMYFVKQTYNLIVHGYVPREEECMYVCGTIKKLLKAWSGDDVDDVTLSCKKHAECADICNPYFTV